MKLFIINKDILKDFTKSYLEIRKFQHPHRAADVAVRWVRRGRVLKSKGKGNWPCRTRPTAKPAAGRGLRF